MVGALANRCAVVTGASRGLGFAIARKYVEAGAHVMICARDAEPLERAHHELLDLAGVGQSVLAQAADISRSDDVNILVERALHEFGRLEVLVNNAGVAGPAGPLEDVEWRGWLH